MIRRVLISLILSLPLAAQAWSTNGFDTDEYARFAKVNAAVGFIQDSNTLSEAQALQERATKYHKRHQSTRSTASVINHYFDHVLAVGLSETEMQNLAVSPGDKIEVAFGDRVLNAYVYRASGAYRPPESTVNLSVAMARKLKVHSGDHLELRKPSSAVAAMPMDTEKSMKVK